MGAIGALLIAAHGVVHLIGVTLLWKLGEPGQFRYADMVPTPGTGFARFVGALWLGSAVALVVAGALAFMRSASWAYVALTGVFLSVPVLTLDSERSVAGLVVDGAIAVAAGVSIVRARREAAG